MAKRPDGASCRTMTAQMACEHLRAAAGDDETRGAVEALWAALGKTGGVVALASDIMSAVPADHVSNDHYREFENLLDHDYLDFARRDSFPGEADAYSRLKTVAERMRQIRLARHLARRNICTIAGGFSSGKSSLLNRLVNPRSSSVDDDILPTSITPTTAIPTYVSRSEDDTMSIRVFNASGGNREVGAPTLREMTHDFGKVDGLVKQSLPLKAIVDRVSILTPHLQQHNVAFIDTPGYTNRGDGIVEDEQVAIREVLNSQFLIWVVDCEKGTLPQEDVDFIRRYVERLGRLDAPIYLVLNKADKKRSDRQAILDAVEETVRKNGFPVFGIGLYSAHRNEWYEHKGGDFQKYLEAIDDHAPRSAELDGIVKKVFDAYITHHRDEKQRLGKVKGLLSRLTLARDDDDGRSESRLSRDLERHADDVDEAIEHHESAAEDARALQRRLVECTQKFMEAAGLPSSTGSTASGRQADVGESGPSKHDFGDSNGSVAAHRHSNGGGWIADTATVMDSVYVGRNAQVFGDAKVSDHAQIRDSARVSGNAEIYGNAQVFDHAEISDDAVVCDIAKVYGDAKVGGNAWVEDHARVSGKVALTDNARVYGGAELMDEARVAGDAKVYDNAKMFDNARVFGDAKVFDNAKVSDNAKVFDNAEVYDNARVFGDAKVFGDAEVFDNAMVFDNAKVSGNARVFYNAEVYDNTRVAGDAKVSGQRHVYRDKVVSLATRAELEALLRRGTDIENR